MILPTLGIYFNMQWTLYYIVHKRRKTAEKQVRGNEKGFK